MSAPVSVGRLDAAAGIRAYRGPLLAMVAESDDDSYTTASRTIVSESKAAPKRREVMDGTAAHGTDLLNDPRVATRVKRSIFEFLDAHRG
jgi:hypothetical protein